MDAAVLVVGYVLMAALIVASVRTVLSSNRTLVRQIQDIRDQGLAAYILVEREETARVIAETRAATAKMDAVAQALWDGLQGTVR